LPAERCLDILRIMVRTRAMEERMIKMSSRARLLLDRRPGEEAFNSAWLQVKRAARSYGTPLARAADAQK